MATSNAAIPLSGVRFDKYSALRVRYFFYECTKLWFPGESGLTLPNKGWFTYFRWYGPTQAFFDKTWKLPDIEKLK
jgi:hypothetical protein